MTVLSLLPRYMVWHYGRGIRDGVVIWENYMWFFYHLFSIPALFATLFSPWRRLGEHPARHSGMQVFFEALLVNTLMRFAGALVRLMFIFFGALTLLAGVFVGALCFFLWCVLPLICALLYVIGCNSFLQIV